MDKKILTVLGIIVPIIVIVSFAYVDMKCDTFTTFGKCVNFEDHKNNIINNQLTVPFGITIEEFNDLESKVNVTNYKKIIPILKHNNGDIEKTLEMLNWNK
jgi:hypothetical protein